MHNLNYTIIESGVYFPVLSKQAREEYSEKLTRNKTVCHAFLLIDPFLFVVCIF